MEEYTRTLNKLYRELTLGWDQYNEVCKLVNSSFSDDFDKATEIIDLRIQEVIKPILDNMSQEEIEYVKRCIDED